MRSCKSCKPSLLGTAGILLLASLSLHAEEAVPAEMARVPGGRFKPPLVRESPEREVKSFFLDVRQVTNGEFLEFVRAHPEWRRSRVQPAFADSHYLEHWAGDLDLGPAAESLRNAPVVNVSWFAVRAFLRAGGKRLPALDEWEFAARADATDADATKKPDFARMLLDWYGRPTPKLFPPAGTGEANIHGVRALHGLVWEWVNDSGSVMNSGEGRNGGGPERDLFCGAGALGAADKNDYAAFMRQAFRGSLRGNFCVANLGFRGARDLVLAPPSTPGSVQPLSGAWQAETGERIELKSLAGKVRVVAMGFTSCQAICPRLIAELQRVEKLLGDLAGTKVGFVFVSLDPGHDTPERLREFARDHRLNIAGDWRLLRSDPDATRELSMLLGIQYETLSGGGVAHSSTIVVLDAAGQVVHRQTGMDGDPAALVRVIQAAVGKSAAP